jgi:AraC-like DNA-binding protein
MERTEGRRSVRGAKVPAKRTFAPYKLAALIEVAEEDGLAVDRILRGTNLSKAALDDPRTKSSVEQYLIACSNALDLGIGPDVPFRVGRRLHLSAYGLYGFALICSPTVRDGFALAVRYHSLATPIFSIAFYETPPHFVWTFPDEATQGYGIALQEFLLAQQLSQHVTHVQDIARSDRNPIRVSVRLEQPSNAPLYGDYLRCPVEFGAAATEIVYDLSVLDERPPLTNRVTLAQLRESCERLIGDVDLPHGIASHVVRAMMERPDKFPNMTQVAAILGMTSRTLRRRLADEGTTFVNILDRVRRDLAIRYLTSNEFSIEDIALLLSFTDAASFRKSFRRWTGKSPSDYR